MPELPEVETIAQGLARRVTGDVIESIWLGRKPEPLKSPAREIAATVEDARIAAVRRMGKHIVFDLESNGVERPASPTKSQQQLRDGRKRSKTRSTRPQAFSHADADKSVRATRQFIVHLGMSGRLQVCEAQEEIAKHTHAIAKLASGRELRFVDPRRFGRLSVSNGFAAPGSEPLDVELAQFVKLFRGRKTPIKSALLNQNLLSGVGNIYADESLFRACVRPRRRAATLTRDELGRLYQSVQKVLKEAIALGGSSISDYVDSDGEEGFFQLQHRVYGREGKRCLLCRTPVKRIVISGRSAHYCSKCQK